MFVPEEGTKGGESSWRGVVLQRRFNKAGKFETVIAWCNKTLSPQRRRNWLRLDVHVKPSPARAEELIVQKKEKRRLAKAVAQMIQSRPESGLDPEHFFR